MGIPTSRTHEAAIVSIESALCTGCGLCVTVCKDFNLRLCEGKACLAPQSIFGCVGCGHCMAVCPAEAISVRGRSLAPDDMFSLPPKRSAADFASLQVLLLRRRSVREFLPDPVPQEQIEAILNAARTAPTGVPPSDVNVLVLDSLEKKQGLYP